MNNKFSIGDFVKVLLDDESDLFNTCIGKIINILDIPTKYKYEVKFIESVKTPTFIYETRSYSEKELELYSYNIDLLEKLISEDT